MSFASFVPASNPEYYMMVVIDEPNVEDQSTGGYATNLTKSLWEAIIPYLNLFPTRDTGETPAQETEPQGAENPANGESPEGGENPANGENPEGESPEGGGNPANGENPEGGESPASGENPGEAENIEEGAYSNGIFQE